MEIEENKVILGFINGRHRTCWLIQSGLEKIPVGFEEKDIHHAKSIGLILGPVDIEDTIDIA